MPPTPLRVWEGQRTWVLSALGHRSSPDPSLRLRPFYHARQETGFELADGLRPGETHPARPRAARRRAGPARPSSRSDSRTRCGRRGRSTCWSGFPPEAGARSSPATRGRRPTWSCSPTTRRPPATADDAAQRFLAWLRTTERRWAVVLDGVASPVDIDGLWPQGPAGQVVVTSRLRESELAAAGASVTAHAVAGFSRREALGYLNARLTGFPDQRIEALDLAEDLGGLPIALAQAAAVVTVTESTCREYRAEYAQRLQTATADARRRLPAVAARHLVARRRARPRAAARRPVLARARVRLGPRHQRDPGRGPHLPRRVRLHHRAAGTAGRTATRTAPPRRTAGRHRAEPRAVRLRHPGAARPAQRGPHQRGAHRLAAHGGAGRGPRLPGAGQRRAGGDRGGHGAA